MDTTCCPNTTLQSDSGNMRLGLAIAITLHIGLATVLAIVRPPPTRRIEVDSLSVDIIPQAAPTEPQIVDSPPAEQVLAAQKAPLPEAEPTLPSTPQSRQPSPEDPVPPQRGMIRATELFASTILNDPNNAAIRVKLKNTSNGERMVQICNTEAMEQVATSNNSYAPDFVVAYATEEVAIIGDTVLVDGGAFRSQKSWYEIRYNCAFKSNTNDIESFEFITGDPIPETLWEDLSLPYD